MEKILQEFSAYIATLPSKSLKQPSLLITIVQGLRQYFDKSIGQLLLYRFERVQYAEQMKKYITGPKVIVGNEKHMSSVYGAEHLLRMLGEFHIFFFVIIV